VIGNCGYDETADSAAVADGSARSPEPALAP
jgi:hypothetical protein